MRKRIPSIVLAVLLALAVYPGVRGMLRSRLTAARALEMSAADLERAAQGFLESRWKGIVLNVQFTPDDTAMMHAELGRGQLCELIVVPDWIRFALPEALSLDLQASPHLDGNDEVVLESVAFSVNGTAMPDVVGNAVCTGLAYKVNELLREQGIGLQSLRIEDDMLRLETKNSSGH